MITGNKSNNDDICYVTHISHFTFVQLIWIVLVAVVVEQYNN